MLPAYNGPMVICGYFVYPPSTGRGSETFLRLRQKLPFEDDEFDHVHIQGMAFAEPENKVCPVSLPRSEFGLDSYFQFSVVALGVRSGLVPLLLPVSD